MPTSISVRAIERRIDGTTPRYVITPSPSQTMIE